MQLNLASLARSGKLRCAAGLLMLAGMAYAGWVLASASAATSAAAPSGKPQMADIERMMAQDVCRGGRLPTGAQLLALTSDFKKPVTQAAPAP
jgi:hypothetical protein